MILGREDITQDGGFGSTVLYTQDDADTKENEEEINAEEKESDKLIKAETSEQGRVSN